MMIKACLLVCAAAVANAAGLISPVGVNVGHVAYGAPYGSPYGAHYAPYGAAYGAPWGGWNPYSYNPYNTYPAQPALASQTQNIYRSPYNLGQISTYTKAIDTPFSSVRKADVRVSNPGVAVASGYSPYVSHVGVAPVTKVATGGLLGVAYSAAPAVSHMTFSNGLGLTYSW